MNHRCCRAGGVEVCCYWALLACWWWWLFPACKHLWGTVQWINHCLRCFLCVCVFFKCRSACTYQSTLFGQGLVHSGPASWGDCGRTFPVELHVSSSLWRVSRLCLDSMVSPLRRHWIKDVFVFSCNLPPALLAGWLKSFTCSFCNTGLDWIPK